MMRIEEMSVRLGMSLRDQCALGTKKGRALCASFWRRRALRPRARAALKPESAGREGHRRLLLVISGRAAKREPRIPTHRQWVLNPDLAAIAGPPGLPTCRNDHRPQSIRSA